MKFLVRIRFFFGILFVLIIVGLLVLYLNDAMSTVHSRKAQLGADTANIGLDYPGVLVKQNVTEGDKVTKGQVLFDINSPQLIDDLNKRTVEASTLPFNIDPKTQDILLKARDDGIIESVKYHAGSYIPASSVVATIDTPDTLYISAHYHLTPPDYARVKKGGIMEATFPDNTKVKATVYAESLTTNGDTVDTVILARVSQADASDLRFPIGTPVDASLKLTQRTWYQDVTDFIHKLFKPTAG